MVTRLADKVRAALVILGPLGAGSRVLLLRLVGRFGWKTMLACSAITLFALFRYRTVFGWLLALWCAASWMHAPAPAKTSTKGTSGPQEETPPEPHGEAWRTFVIQAIGDRQGVHLRDLLDTLHKTGHHPDWEVADVRRVCEAAGIPVRNRVRVRGLGVTVGVHRSDLPPLPGPSPERGEQDPQDSELHLN